MPTIKKLQFANGTDVTEPTDLSLESSTDHLKTYADDAAYEADNGAASAGDIYINTTMNTARLYAGGQWWSVVIKENAIIVDDNFKLLDNGDNTKVGKFDVSNVPTGTTKTYAVPAITTSSDVLVTQDATQELKNKTIDGNLNTLTNLDFGTLSGEVNPQNGGTGISNPAGATLTRTGAFDLNITCTAETDVTMPVSGTLATLTDITASNLTGTVPLTKGGLGTDASGFAGVVKVSGGNASASTIVNNDISATAAIAYSKLNIGTGDIDATKIAGGLVTDSEFDKLHTAGDNGPNNLVTCSGTQTISNKLHVAPEIFDNIKFVEQASSPATPDTSRVLVYAKEDGKIYKKDDTGAETEIGAGGSGTGRNYLQDWFDGSKPITVASTTLGSTANRTLETTLWARSTVAGLTIQNNTVSPLRQAGDFLVNSSATTINSFVESPLWTLDVADLGKPVSVEFDITGIDASTSYDVVVIRYNSSGTHQEIISVAGNASTGTPVSAQLPTGTVKFRGFYIAGSTSTDQYALRLRKVAAVDDDFQIDSLFVGPQSLAQGAVVTAWQAYTPVFSGVTATGSVYYRRVGDSIEVEGLVDCTAAAASTFKIPLPTGLSIDTTKISGNQKNTLGIISVSNGGGGSSLFAAAGISGVIIADSSDNNAVFVALLNASDASGNVTASPIQGAGLFNSTGQGTFRFTAPISQWSSGTTTLADRAVEEYAFNTSTSTTTSDTTSFGYGPDGWPISAITAQLDRTVRFQTPILSTDSIVLEIKDDVNGRWTNIASAMGGNPVYFQRQGTLYYGLGVSSVGQTTDVVVRFGQYWFPNNASYAQPGQPWSSLANFRWRVRKVSSGAAVGFPVSARNIVGDTTGTAVPTGMIGEVVTQSITRSAQTSFTSGVARNITTNPLQLSAGVWEISANFIAESGSGDTISQASIGIGTTPATLPAGDIIGVPDSGGQIRVIWTGSVTNNMTNVCISPYRVIVSSSLTLYAVGIATHAGGAANIFGSFRAVRIA